MSSQEILEKFSVEVFEKNFQYNYTSMTVSMLQQGDSMYVSYITYKQAYPFFSLIIIRKQIFKFLRFFVL